MPKKTKENQTSKLELKEIVLEEKLHNIVDEDMAGFSGAVLLDRSIPNVVDGIKTCARRCLWTLYNLRLWNSSAEKKLAYITGSCLGSWHPHGSSSISGVLNIMNETFMNNYPFCENTGNIGSMAVSGPDSAAADRYTSCKLSKFGEAALEYMDKETCDFKPNFSGEAKEPVYIPSIIPLILTQYNFGLGVGYMCTWYGHNVEEAIKANIHRIKNPNCRLNSILDIMPAPDFPTAGIILDYQNLKQAYETGSGKFTLRGETEIKDNSIFIKSLPHRVYINNFMREMDDLLENPALNIVDIIDKSSVIDKGGLFKVDIEVKCKKGTDMKFIENFILKNTSLQTSCNVEMRAIVDNKPMLCPLLFTLDKVIEHQNNVLIKAFTFDLNKAKARLEIVEGLLKVISSKSILDKVIALIRGSKTKEEAKEKLIKEFDLTENQAIAILQIRLQQLTSMDLVQLQEEEKELKATIENCKKVISDKEYRKTILINKLKEYAKLFNKPRNTQINKEATGDINIKVEELISDEDRVVALSHDGQLKLSSTKSFNSNEHWSSDLNLQDYIVKQQIVSNKAYVCCFTNLGRVIPVQIHKLKDKPWKDGGISLSDKFDTLLPDEKMVTFIPLVDKKDPTVVFVSQNGLIKLMKLSEIPTTRQKFTQVFKIKNNDKLVYVDICDEKKDICCSISKHGQILAHKIDDITVQGKVSGGMNFHKMKKEDIVIGACVYSDKSNNVLLVGDKSNAKYIELKNIELSNKTTQGIKVSPEKDMNLVFACKIRIPANKTQYILGIDQNDKTNWLLLENLEKKQLSQKMSKLSVGPLKVVLTLDNISSKKEVK